MNTATTTSRIAATTAAALIALAGASPRAQTVTDPTLVVEAVIPAGSLEQPTTLAFLAANDFLVLEKATGRVRRVLDGALLPEPVLTVPVNSAGERGLLGIAINTLEPPQVFLYFTEAATPGGTPLANRVYRYTWDPGSGQLVAPFLVLDLPYLTGPNHDGGVVALGPPGQFPGVGDGAALYALIGDLFEPLRGQLQNNALGIPPDDTGVIFRVLQDGTAAPGNPYTPYCSVTTTQTCASDASCPAGQSCRTRVARYFAYGVRNGFGLALDPLTGALWDTENGPGEMDEVNRVAPGMNSGWADLMGPDALDANTTADLWHMPGEGVTYDDPEFSFLDTNAPTGIVLPVGTSLGSAYDAVALVGDVNIGQIYRFPLNASRTGFTLEPPLADLVADTQAEADGARWGQGFAGVTDLDIGPDGHLYVVSIGGETVYRIRGPGSTEVPAFPQLAP